MKLVALMLLAAPAFAQVANMPAHVQQRLAEVGPGWGKDIAGNIEKTLEVYTPLLAVAPKQGITVQRDLAYGADARHRADIFRADGLKNVSAPPTSASGPRDSIGSDGSRQRQMLRS